MQLIFMKPNTLFTFLGPQFNIIKEGVRKYLNMKKHLSTSSI